MTTIKITALTDIGANIPNTTLIPVVDMTGTPTTDKATFGNVANAILSQAGNNYSAATKAVTVTASAQPNITSVGTLTALTVTGNVTANRYFGDGGFLSNVTGGNATPGGSNSQVQYNDNGAFGGDPGMTYNEGTSTLTANNFIATSNSYLGNISTTGSASITTLLVGATANLGAVGNVTITGGSNGQVLTTNGTGGLSWTSVSGNGTYGNADVANYLPTYTGNLSASNLNVPPIVDFNLSTDDGNGNIGTWTFDTAGKLYWPGPDDHTIYNGANNSFVIHAHNNIIISTDGANANYQYQFYANGDLGLPGNVSATVFSGNGSSLSAIAGANVTGFVPNANVANTAFAVAGANVSGTVGNANLSQYLNVSDVNNNFSYHIVLSAGSGDKSLHIDADDNLQYNPADGTLTATRVDATYVLADLQYSNGYPAANVTGLGNIATINLTGSTSNVLYGNGVFAPAAGGGGNVSELVNGNNSFVLDSAGNVVFEGTPSGNAVDRGLVWDYGANANGVNSQIRQDLNGLIVRAWTENAGNYIAPVNIITGQDANTNTWKFDGQGNLTVPSGSINSISDAGDLRAYLTLNPDLGIAKLAGRGALANVNYTNTSWSTATYTGTQIDFTNAPDLVTFFNTNQFNVGVNQTFSINGDEPVPFTGYTIGSGSNVIVYTSVTADPDPTTVTSINFSSQLESYVAVDYDGNELNIIATGLTILIDNDQTEGPDITLRSGDDITLQAKDMSLGSEREGGDINLNAGDGADDDGTGNTASTGGDIIIDAGRGGDGNSSSGSTGGFTQITGGRGGTAGVTNLAGEGGYVQIAGGDGGFNNSNTALGASGGDVNIYGGDTTREGYNGASVNLTSGAGGANAFAGSVNISTPSSDSGPGGLWQFDGAGLLTLPDGAIIDTIGNNFEVRAIENVNFEANAVVNIYTDGSNNAYQWQFGDDGLITLPGGNTKIGTQYGSEAILASNVAFGIVSQGTAGMTVLQWTDDVSNTSQFSAVYINESSANVGDIQIRTGAVGNANIWKFGNDGNLTLPSNTFAVNYANGTPVSIGGGGNTGNVTFDNVTVQGVNGLNLSAGSDFTANLAYLQVRAGDVASHIHLDTGNNEAYDLIVGDDQNYVQVSSTGNILLSSYDSNTAQYIWTLDYNGNLILAGGNSVIQSIANSSLDPTLPNVSTMVLTPDANYNSQVLVLDPTAPGHIHLRAFSPSNIDAPAANIFLGGEDTAFEITEGANNQAVIHSNGKAWTFGNDGNISSDTLTLTTTFANVKTVEYQTAGVWDLYVEDGITGSNTASSRLNVSFKDNLIDKPQVYIENTKESDGIALRWTFDENGNLNFPRDVAGNTDPYLSIFGGSTPTIQSTDVSLAGPANLAIVTDYLNLSGADGDKIVFYADTGEMATDANMTLTTNLANTGNTSSWVFGTDGNLTIPSTSGGFIKTASNASIGVAAVDNGTNNPAQLLSINAGLGAATSIVSAYATNATIQTNATGTLNTWQFDNAGNLTLPTGGQIIVSGGLVSSGASPAPTINGFSITNSVGISGNGNIAGNNISATGNVSGNFFLGNGSQLTGITATSLVNGTSNVVTTSNGNVTIGIAGNAAIATFTGTGANVTGTLNVTGNVTAQGVGTNLVRRANTISGSNTVVTLDNLTALVGGTPKRLYIGAATSNMTMAGQSQTMSTGALAVSSWINVPIVTGVGNGFAMSGAITNDGDTAVLNVTDQGAGSGTWRVTGMIANTSANLYSVSIERLA